MSGLHAVLETYKTQTIAVAFHDLQTGKEILVNADEAFHPASTIKVAVMMEAYRQAALGKFSLDEKIPVINSFASAADGKPFSVEEKEDSDASLYEKIGAGERARELVRLMIVRSSNLATNLLIERIGAPQVDAFLRELGIEGIKILRGVEDGRAFALGMNNSASARGLARIMEFLAEGKVVSPEASREMIEILLQQEFNESIPARLPASARVAHKTGSIENAHHDFGIVYPNGRKPYALAILTRGFGNENEAHDCMAAISELLYKETV